MYRNSKKPEYVTALEQYFGKNAIAKQDLLDRAYYQGTCRNAEVAMWDAKEQEFRYVRHKFKDTFIEGINHYEDDDGSDVFIPFFMTVPEEREKV